MAVINCPECNGKVSDTLSKCPHCGYVIKEEKKQSPKSDLKPILGKLKKNKKLSIIIGICLFIIICFSIIAYISTSDNRLTEKVVEYLEDEDYKCRYKENYDDYNDEVYVCKKDDEDKEYELVISWGHGSLLKNMINISEKENFQILLKYRKRSVSTNFYLSSYLTKRNNNYLRLDIGGSSCVYNPEGYRDEEISFYKAKEVAEPSSYGSCDIYLDEVNEILDIYEDIVDEFKLASYLGFEE